jgi:hypothetical protein
MKFTIVFPSEVSADLSIGVVFVPCLVWVQGQQFLLNPHQSNPHYLKGDLQDFFARTDFRRKIADDSRRVTVVVHPTGHGTEEYLELLLGDLREEGFEPTVVRH